MRFRGLLMLLVSLGLAAVVAVFANRWMANQLAGAGADAELGRVAAASVDIPFGTRLDATHIKMIELPPASVPQGAFLDANEAIGRIAVQHLYPGEVLIAERVVENLSGSALAAAVAKGMRAITVRVDDVIGVGGFLLPGNRVDVIATRRGGGAGETAARTLISNLKVLAVDQTTSPEKDSPVVVRAVTLEATPRQAEEIVQATQEGTVQLALRNPLETVPAEPVVEPEEPAPQGAPPKPPMVAANPKNVDVIRGTNLTSVRFNEGKTTEEQPR